MAAFSSYGVVLAPVGHKWYMVLESVLARRMAMGFWTMIGAKLAADTVLFGPVHIACMLTWTTLAQGRSLEVGSCVLPAHILMTFLSCTHAALRLPCMG